jgi:lipid-binding SYLF domain-containing protein
MTRPQAFARLLCLAAPLLCGIVQAGCATAKGSNPAEKTAYIRGMRDDTLQELAATRPETVAMRRDLPGYAVFDTISMKLLALGSGNGYGVVVDNQKRTETFMRAAQVHVGLGAGVKKMRAVVFFRTREALDHVLNNGWSAGVQATAAAKAGDQGDAVGGRGSIDENYIIYQLTDSGVELTASVGGTKVWVDKELNHMNSSN